MLQSATYPLSVVIVAAQLQVISKHPVSKEMHNYKELLLANLKVYMS